VDVTQHSGGHGSRLLHSMDYITTSKDLVSKDCFATSWLRRDNIHFAGPPYQVRPSVPNLTASRRIIHRFSYIQLLNMTEQAPLYPQHLTGVPYAIEHQLQTLDICLPRPLSKSEPKETVWVVYIYPLILLTLFSLQIS